MKVSEWVSVKDRLPEIGEYVFIVIEMKYKHEKEIETDGFYYIAYLCELFPTKEKLLKSL